MKEELLFKYSNVKKKTLCERILNKKTHYSDLLDRTIVTNSPDEELGNNKISSSKYNLISFPIFNLLYQFTKPSNRTFINIKFTFYLLVFYRWFLQYQYRKESLQCFFL